MVQGAGTKFTTYDYSHTQACPLPVREVWPAPNVLQF